MERVKYLFQIDFGLCCIACFHCFNELGENGEAFVNGMQHSEWIGAVVKVVDSHLCGWGSIPNKSCSFFIVSLSKSLSLCFMCSDQHVKYWMPLWFPLTSSLLLDYHVKQYIHTYTKKLYISTGMETFAKEYEFLKLLRELKLTPVRRYKKSPLVFVVCL